MTFSDESFGSFLYLLFPALPGSNFWGVVLVMEYPQEIIHFFILHDQNPVEDLPKNRSAVKISYNQHGDIEIDYLIFFGLLDLFMDYWIFLWN